MVSIIFATDDEDDDGLPSMSPDLASIRGDMASREKFSRDVRAFVAHWRTLRGTAFMRASEEDSTVQA